MVRLAKERLELPLLLATLRLRRFWLYLGLGRRLFGRGPADLRLVGTALLARRTLKIALLLLVYLMLERHDFFFVLTDLIL